MRRIVLLLIVILIQSSYAAKKSCGTKKACKKFGREFLGMGRCQLKSEDCEGQIAEGRKYCKNTNRCHCCASSLDCKTQKACKMLGGKCQPNKAPCDGTVLSGEDYMNHCKDIYNCACCVPPTAPKPCNVDCDHWCYPSTDWPYTCSNFCNGTKQSPIDICTGSTSFYPGPLIFSGYDDTIPKITIKNNGHTVAASWDSSLPNKTISGAGLIGEYILAQFHFHWGCKSDRGSEHAVDGTRYSMELHLVHYKASYGNLKEALKYADGLAVLGIFFDVSGTFATMGNDDLKPITDNLQDIVEPGSEKEIDFNVPLSNLFPFTQTFYRYEGSLTTPTCNEVVIWSVFSVHKSFSEEQAQSFRKLMDKEGNILCDNYRGIQPFNGRVIKKYT